jgi:tripartite-type tricarboxylate transporter receptor subunit TctC
MKMQTLSKWIVTLLLTLALAPTLAGAQAWPARPIKMICPFPAGGGTDVIARIVAQQLSIRLKQNVFVENRGGANGGAGSLELARSAPDGYTIGAISDSPNTVNPSLYGNLQYVPLRDFIPMARVNHFPSYLVAHPSVPFNDVAGLIAYAKANPGKLNYSSGGVGNFSHLGLAMLAFQTGIDIVHVPYRGIGPATTAILAGDVQLTYNNVATAKPHVETGKLKGLGVGTSQRLPALPNVPAIAETVPGFNVTPWVGIFLPAKAPKEIAERLSKEVEALLKDPAVVKNFADQQIRAAYLDTPAFTAEIRKESEAWAKVIQTLGIKVQ